MDRRNVTGNGDPRMFNPGVAIDPSITTAWGKAAKERRSKIATPIKLDLPSGVPAKVIRMPVKMLLHYGHIPDPLTPIILDHIKMIEGKAGAEAADVVTEAFDENPEKVWNDWVAFLDVLWLACVVEPKFTANLDEVNEDTGPFWLEDVDFYDKLYVYQWSQGVDQSVADFLHEQAEAVGAASNVDGVPNAAEQLLQFDERGRLARPDHQPGDVDVGLDGGTVGAGDEGSPVPETPETSDIDGPGPLAAVDHPGDLRAAARERRRKANQPEIVPAS